jgi:hypothetical protein
MSKMMLPPFIGIVIGKLNEIKPLHDDNSNNPRAMISVRQRNPMSPKNLFDHWILVWGKSKMRDLDTAKIGQYVLVIYKSYPFDKVWKEKSTPSMQNQVLFLSSLGSIFSSNKSKPEPEPVHPPCDDSEPVEASETTDDVPF